MKRLLLALAGMVACISLSQAKDEVTVRLQEKPLSGKIAGESAKGVVLDGKTIAPDEIIDIFYDLPSDLKFGGAYSKARGEEKDSLDPTKEAKLKDHLDAALKKYQETYTKVQGEKELKVPEATRGTWLRHMKYKMATLKLRLALETSQPTDDALAALTEFKDKYPASWQIVPVVQALAQLHLGKSDFKAAIGLYEELAKFDLGDDTRLEAEIQAAAIAIRAKMPDAALAKLEALKTKLPKGSKQALRVEIAIGEGQAAKGDIEGAVKLLRGIIESTPEKGVKAAAYNAIGEAFMKKNLWQAARWEFLWVDVIYNQDRIEHARALFRLAETFDQIPGEGDRAQQCFKLVADNRDFAGLEYQRLAVAALKSRK